LPTLTDETISHVLRRNLKESIGRSKTAMMMAFSPRLGAASHLAQTFHGSSIGDLSVLRLVWEMLWPTNYVQTASITTPYANGISGGHASHDMRR
jgi:hypothetical protein